MKKENTNPSAAGVAAQITEAEVVAFFNARLAEFKEKRPGYVSLSLDVTNYDTGGGNVEWSAYHEDTGHTPTEARHCLTCALGWHTTPEAIKAKIAKLRERALAATKEADDMEAANALAKEIKP